MTVVEMKAVVEMTNGSAFDYHRLLTVSDAFERAGVVNWGASVKIGVFYR